MNIIYSKQNMLVQNRFLGRNLESWQTMSLPKTKREFQLIINNNWRNISNEEKFSKNCYDMCA